MTLAIKKALGIFKGYCFKNQWCEDDSQEAVYLCLKRKGVAFWEQPIKHVVIQLITALREAHHNNSPLEQRTGRLPVVLLGDKDMYEDNQPLYVKYYDDRKALDNLVKRATISNHQLQIFYMFMRGETGRYISQTFDIHVNSVTNILNAVRDKLHAVRVGALV
tara:strand:+ start:34722 stop:35210 length:489 start_codon:yes stop_codon:yes gene_type:complete